MPSAVLPDAVFKAIGVQPAVIANVKRFIQDGSELPDALRLAQSTADIDESTRNRLQFCADIVSLCGSNIDGCIFLLNDSTLKSLGDVALKYYCTKENIPGKTQIRSELLYRVPTAVLSAVANSGVLGLDSTVHKPLSQLLSIAVQENYDIREQSLGSFLSRPASLKELSLSTPDDARQVRNLLETLYRLHPLVVDAEDIRYLIKTRFTSARIIAGTNQDDFLDEMDKTDLAFSKSANIYLEATRIDRRNEAFWADIIRTRREVPVLAMTGLIQPNTPDKPGDSEAHSTNLDTLFRDLDSVTADESTSVLSPASYLVDLLQMLSKANLSLPPTRVVEGAINALDILVSRRPDILTIKLSRKDTETPMAYQALTIEVVEKYLDSVINPSSSPESPKKDIYEDVSRNLAPMTTFPYNNAIASNRAFLQARGYSRYELLRRFQSTRELAKRAFPTAPSTESKFTTACQAVHDRRLASESLGLQALDFQAITQESFHTRQFVRLLQGQRKDLAAKTYEDVVALSAAGEYWGYESDDKQTATERMTSPTSDTTLRLIKKELLPRSGLTPSQLMTLLKTRYIGNRLVLTSASATEFSDRLEDMRLQESLLVQGSEESGRLSERSCLDLQAFLRLRSRLGWSIEDTDAAIAALARRTRIYENDDRRHFVLDEGFVERLAAAKDLSIVTGVPLLQLLPLWGPMDAQFPQSLYTKLFLRPSLVSQYPSLRIVDGDVLEDATFGQNMIPMLQALQLTQADQLVFMKLLNFDHNTPWTLDNVARIYAHEKLCRILEIPSQCYPDWWRLASSLANPFLDPQSTWQALEPWLTLTTGSISIQTVLGLLIPMKQQQPSAMDLNTVSDIIRRMLDLENEYDLLLADKTDIEAAQVYNSDTVLSLCSRVLGPVVSKEVLNMIEGRSPTDDVVIRTFSQQFDVKGPDVLAAFDTPVPKGNQMDLDRNLTVRRQKAIKMMVPKLRRRSSHDAVNASLAARFPAVDLQLLESLLEEVIPKASRSEYETYRGRFQAFLTDAGASLRGPLTGILYFFPPSSSDYTFTSTTEHGQLVLDNQVVSFHDGKSHSLQQGRSYTMLLSEGLSLRDLAYSTADGQGEFSEGVVLSASLASDACDILRRFGRALEVTKKLDLDAAEVKFHNNHGVAFSDLDMRQMKQLLQFTRTRSEFKASGKSLINYLQYLYRSSTANLSQDETVAKDQLITETRLLTGLPALDITTFMDKEWPAILTQNRAQSLLDLTALHRLAECYEMSKQLEIPMEALYRWAECPVLPGQPEDLGFYRELEISLSSGSAANSVAAARESLQSQKQKILQEYLLCTPGFKSKGVKTLDDLSAEFLIDVQIGPALVTSRIAQAIASVQLFVQRCSLGLEKVYGIATDKISSTQWKWMGRFTLWQANRKVFLYPENWLEPSLRDDKTEAFQELEIKVLQSNLNKETISQLLRDYVYAAHEVADLYIQSYLWEAAEGFRGSFHFFARTRNAPFTFYYRRMTVSGASAAAARWNWRPWTKMEVDIPTHEVDIDRKPLARPGSYLLPAIFRKRLFIFIPQIIRQTEPAKPNDGTTSLVDKANDKQGPDSPVQYWEVKMGWAEMRNNKWSPKYITATGISVKAGDKVPLPPISSFRFRLNTRKLNETDEVLSIFVDKWIGEGSKSGDAQPGKFTNLGFFEMQGTRLRLVDTTGGQSVGSSIGNTLSFGRITSNTSTKTATKLRDEISALKVGIDSDTQKSLLAVPDPGTLLPSTTKYELSWLLTFDSSQFNGASGLIVETSTASQAQTFFGFPTMNAEGKLDTSLNTTAVSRKMTHEAVLNLVEEIADKEGYEGIFDALETLPESMQSLAFGKDGPTYNEMDAPGSLYNWELGFHAVALIVERLLATQQFDLALEMSRLVFDPSRDDVQGSTDSSKATKPKPLSRLDRCWRFIPFKSSEVRLSGSVRDIIQRLAPGRSTNSEIADWVANPFSPHTVARGRPAVYMKRFVMKCIETLIAAGDQYFRQESMEAIPLAIQRYVEASELFGPAPITIDPLTKPINKSYAEIQTLVNDFATASVDMELEFPFFINPLGRSQKPPLGKTQNGTLGFVRSTYFSVPANPQMKALRELIDDRLYKIRNGLDINGNPRRLPLFDPPIDPGQLMAALNAGGTLSSFVSGSQGPMPNYRAKYLLQKAVDLCNELRAFADSYVSIKEKRDAEAMSSLRVRQESGVLSLMTAVKRHQTQEAQLSVEALEETRKGHVSRLQYHLELMGESTDKLPTANMDWIDIQQAVGQVTKDELRASPEETVEMEMTEKAKLSNNVATSLEHLTASLMALPAVTAQFEPMGVGTSVQMDASIVAKSIMVGVGVIRAAAQQSNDNASRASRKGQMIRQLQERRMQANSAGRDIKVVDKQIAGQKKRFEIVQAELRAHEQQVADNAETEAYLRTKYTSEKLYAWLDVETRKLMYGTYLAALDMAKTAERALSFEYGPKAQPFISNAYWDQSRDGLLAAQHLTAALHRMDTFYIQNSTHDYELTKTVSLRQISPLALIDIRTKGLAEFDIPEVAFDHDFPGHYCRRIKTISLSIPSVVGPYTGVSCTLQLLEHKYRLKAGRSSTGSYYVEDVSNDERFHSDHVPITSIALSSCNQDNGTFELNFRDDRYVPFEGAGVISKWKLELPGPYPQFDYTSISDVLLTIRYTALEGGALWKKAASDAVREFRGKVDKSIGGDGAFMLVDLRAEFATEWHIFGNRLIASSDTKTPVTMDISRLPNLLPFWTSRHSVKVERIFAAIQPAKDGWGGDGEMKVLGSTLAEQEQSGPQLRLLGMPVDEGEHSTTLGLDLLKANLAVSVIPSKLNQRVPDNFWVIIQYTTS